MRTRIYAVAGAVLLISISLLATAGDGATASSNVSLAIDVGHPSGCVSISQGQEVEVFVKVANVEDLTKWEATIVHDYDVVQIETKDNTLFFSGFSTLQAQEPLPDNDGRHLLGAAIFGPGSVSGSGSLASVVFKAVGVGLSTIDLPQLDVDSNGTTDWGPQLESFGEPIGDNNSDSFFDGPVTPGTIAVGQGCGDTPTNSPTPPPTPAPTGTPTAAPTASAGSTPSPGATSTAQPTSTPGPTGGGSPTAPPTATPQPTGSGAPVTPTPTATPTPAATASPTPSPVPGAELVWGDANCSGSADPVDALHTLRHDAGLGTSADGCPIIGQQLGIAGVSFQIWGDIDCSGDVDPVDALKLLRFDAGLAFAAPETCPALGQTVVIAPEAG